MLYVGGRWTLQWKGWEPAVEKATTPVLPFGRAPPMNIPSSEGMVCAVPEETVWAKPLLFTQQTFCPATIAGGLAGLNVNEPVALMVTLAPEPVQLAGGLELGPTLRLVRSEEHTSELQSLA